MKRLGLLIDLDDGMAFGVARWLTLDGQVILGILSRLLFQIPVELPLHFPHLIWIIFNVFVFFLEFFFGLLHFNMVAQVGQSVLPSCFTLTANKINYFFD